jgi:hypothetical protein
MDHNRNISTQPEELKKSLPERDDETTGEEADRLVVANASAQSDPCGDGRVHVLGQGTNGNACRTAAAAIRRRRGSRATKFI